MWCSEAQKALYDARDMLDRIVAERDAAVEALRQIAGMPTSELALEAELVVVRERAERLERIAESMVSALKDAGLYVTATNLENELAVLAEQEKQPESRDIRLRRADFGAEQEK